MKSAVEELEAKGKVAKAASRRRSFVFLKSALSFAR